MKVQGGGSQPDGSSGRFTDQQYCDAAAPDTWRNRKQADNWGINAQLRSSVRFFGGQEEQHAADNPVVYFSNDPRIGGSSVDGIKNGTAVLRPKGFRQLSSILAVRLQQHFGNSIPL
ncbi:hypothetical protein D3C73_890930 [compost metagenome]